MKKNLLLAICLLIASAAAWAPQRGTVYVKEISREREPTAAQGIIVGRQGSADRGTVYGKEISREQEMYAPARRERAQQEQDVPVLPPSTSRTTAVQTTQPVQTTQATPAEQPAPAEQAVTPAAPVAEPEPVDPNTPAITFNGKKFYLKYSAGDDDEWANEYLPYGQNFEEFTEMISIRYYKIKGSAMEMTRTIAADYARKNGGSRQFIGEDKQKGEGVVAFVQMADTIYEATLFRVVSQKGHPVAMQYVYRSYPPAGEGRDLARRKFVEKWTSMLGELQQVPVPTAIKEVIL